MIRAALIGYGLAGAAFHAPLIEAVPALELSAIVTRDPERRAAAQRTYPGAELLDDADQIVRRAGDFELVVVATPNRTHVPLARAAIDASLAVVVDKPLAGSAAEARELLTAAEARGVTLTVFQNRRWDGDFMTARRLIAAGELGAVLRFESRFERWRPQVGSGWRELAPVEERGGLLYDLGSHLVDQALQLFGPAREVYAELDLSRSGAAVDDDSFVALTHASGVRSHLWMGAVTAQLGPRMRVLGDRAAYVKYGLDVQEDELRAGRTPDQPGFGEDPQERWGLVGVDGAARRVRTENGAYVRFYEQLAAALRADGPPPVDVRDAIAALEVIEAARRAAEQRRVVALAPAEP